MRSIGPVFGTFESSRRRFASFLNDTLAKNGLMSPVASAFPCARSRHHAGSLITAVPSSGRAVDSRVRNATLKNAPGLSDVPEPPGWVASALGWARRYLFAPASHRPTPAASRTVLRRGFHARCDTRMSTWRRRGFSTTLGARNLRPDAARATSPTSFPPGPGWTVRNRSAGARTLAPNGNSRSGAPGRPPIAIVNAVVDGSFSVFSVTRNAVVRRAGFTRSSTRSAALFPYFGSFG